MADILGTFKRKAEDLVTAINQRGGVSGTIQSLRHQMAVSDQKRAIAAARAELERLDAQINELITAVGVQTVGLYRANRLQSPELEPLCKHVAELETALEAQRSELAKLEAELRLATPPERASCPSCGQHVPAGATFCPHCGTGLPAAQQFCMHCGSPLREGAKFCAKCGQGV